MQSWKDRHARRIPVHVFMYVCMYICWLSIEWHSSPLLWATARLGPPGWIPIIRNREDGYLYTWWGIDQKTARLPTLWLINLAKQCGQTIKIKNKKYHLTMNLVKESDKLGLTTSAIHGGNGQWVYLYIATSLEINKRRPNNRTTVSQPIQPNP